MKQGCEFVESACSLQEHDAYPEVDQDLLSEGFSPKI
jgi:hypothetical protein